MYSEPCQTSEMDLFTKIVTYWKQFTHSTKNSILDVWQGSQYVSDEVQLVLL